MATTDFTDLVTVIPTAWLNDIDAFYYEIFGATGGKAYIGDTANANMTIGLTINQGASDDQFFAGKSSDVAHGITSLAETDTFFAAIKQSGTAGGIQLVGYTEATTAFNIVGRHTTDDTTKSTAGVASVMVTAQLKSGTTVTDVGADGNLFAILNNGTTRFIFDAEGSVHADVESTTFDEHDDLALIEAMDREFQRRQGNPVTQAYAEHLREHRDTLQRLGIVNYYDPEGKRVFVNMTKQAMLHNGAIRQLAQRTMALEHKLLSLEAK